MLLTVPTYIGHVVSSDDDSPSWYDAVFETYVIDSSWGQTWEQSSHRVADLHSLYYVRVYGVVAISMNQYASASFGAGRSSFKLQYECITLGT